MHIVVTLCHISANDIFLSGRNVIHIYIKHMLKSAAILATTKTMLHGMIKFNLQLVIVTITISLRLFGMMGKV